MPSPFPGMDPYLEHPRFFANLHAGLIFAMQADLQGRLSQAYYAQSGQRVWLDISQRYVEPDVNVMRERSERPHQRQGGVALAEPEVEVEISRAAGEPVLITVKQVRNDDQLQNYLEIHSRWSGQDRLIATIEVVSPSNKSPGDDGYDAYRAKQREVLAGQAHLIEIDLLRAGTHVTAVPKDIAKDKAGPFDYHVSVHRFDRPDEFLVYPIQMQRRLPVITVPLLPEDPPVQLDLQAALNRAYDAGPYRKTIWYGKDRIEPPLEPDQARWAAIRLESPIAI